MQLRPGTKTHDLVALIGIIIFIICFMMWLEGMLLIIGGTFLGGVILYLYNEHKEEIVKAFNQGRDDMYGDDND